MKRETISAGSEFKEAMMSSLLTTIRDDLEEVQSVSVGNNRLATTLVEKHAFGILQTNAMIYHLAAAVMIV